MFGFKKNEKPTLIIEAKDLMEIIKSDYDNDMAFTLIEFSYNEKKYVMFYLLTQRNVKKIYLLYFKTEFLKVLRNFKLLLL